jgi:hypothetical protein
MRRIYTLVIACFIAYSGSTQSLSNSNYNLLSDLEDSLKSHALNMIFHENPNMRLNEDSLFTRQFVRALRTPHSFSYPFDSIITVSKVYAPDSSFRIFTWQYQKDENYFRQRGAIQMKTTDGSLKLYPLFDMSEFTKRPVDSLRTNQNWIGAIYYNVVLKEYNNKKYYTLFGFDDYSSSVTRKWLEVLTFNQTGEPVFGGKVFTYKQDSLKPESPAYRFLLQYKKDGRARMIYDPEMDMIVFDHLISESNDQSDAATLVPDGDYEGFQWKNGQWVHVEKIFNQKIDISKVDPLIGNAPLEDPLRDKQGNLNEDKLTQQSLKNMKAAEEKLKAEKAKAEAAKKKKKKEL